MDCLANCCSCCMAVPVSSTSANCRCPLSLAPSAPWSRIRSLRFAFWLIWRSRRCRKGDQWSDDGCAGHRSASPASAKGRKPESPDRSDSRSSWETSCDLPDAKLGGLCPSCFQRDPFLRGGEHADRTPVARNDFKPHGHTTGAESSCFASGTQFARSNDREALRAS